MSFLGWQNKNIFVCLGVGKSHFIHHKLLEAAHSLNISVNEMFTIRRSIQKFGELPLVKDCVIAFNFTVVYPLVRTSISVFLYKCMFYTR